MLEDANFHNIPQRDRIIVALDCPEAEALKLADVLQGHAKWVKIGMTTYYATGPRIVSACKDRGFNVFLDLKFFDIPHQVEGAAYSAVASGADMITMHASGGADMMLAAVRGVNAAVRDAIAPANGMGDITCDAIAPENDATVDVRDAETTTSNAKTIVQGAKVAMKDAGNATPPITLGITVLTSMNTDTLQQVGITRDLNDQVKSLAQLACASGLSGVVCSAQEARALREQLGQDAYIVTPGIRPAGASTDDQSRITTPAQAFANGSSHIVIGRPITQAPDPAVAFEEIAKTLN